MARRCSNGVRAFDMLALTAQLPAQMTIGCLFIRLMACSGKITHSAFSTTNLGACELSLTFRSHKHTGTRLSYAQLKAARVFVNYLLEPASQTALIQYGIRPADPSIDIATAAGSPFTIGNGVIPTVTLHTVPWYPVRLLS